MSAEPDRGEVIDMSSGRAHAEEAGRVAEPRVASRVVNLPVENRLTRAEARKMVEALTIRETEGEPRRLLGYDYPIRGGLVSTTGYLLGCMYQGRKPWRD